MLLSLANFIISLILGSTVERGKEEEGMDENDEKGEERKEESAMMRGEEKK